MADVNIIIDGKTLSVPAGTTVLEAARANGIRIPTLCFLKELDPRASCRMCVVEIEGARTFQHACATRVREGMVVHTDTEAVRDSRKLTLELLLSNHAVDCHHCLRIGSSRCDDLDPKFCEMCFFCDCVKDGFCELQALAREYKVDVLPFSQKHNTYPLDDSTVIVRNPNKCIKCRRCVDVCGKVQTVHNLAASGRGSELLIGPAFGRSMAESGCIGCGRCVEVCPTGAIHAMEHKDELVYYAHRDGLKTAALVDADVIPELERVLKLQPGSVTPEQIAGSLKKIGTDEIYDAAGAEKAAEAEAEALLAEKLEGQRPVILTNSFAAKAFLEKNFPERKESFVFYGSAVAQFGSALRGQADRLFAVTPVGNDASETEKTHPVDITVNPRELARIMIRTGSEPNPKRTAELKVLPVPQPGGKFGRLLEKAAWSMARDAAPERFTVGELKCVICHNLGQAREVLESGEAFDVIRVIG
ncbi:MAG: (2Fe-2S)-binding protein [Oscillospiraceae bacterium]|nr:(2Fe-2S)-binding protein [Oscillospiraceae bacterium]